MTATKRKAAEQAADRVRDQILRGERRPGSALPAERELAVELGVSRLTLRAAIARLEAEGLVRPMHGSGNLVLDFRESGSVDLVAYLARLSLAHGAMPVELLYDLLELRRAIAVEVFGLACERGTPEDVAALRAQLARQRGLLNQANGADLCAADSKGSRKNKFRESAPRFGSDLADPQCAKPQAYSTYVEDFAHEDRPKMARRWDAEMGTYSCASPKYSAPEARTHLGADASPPAALLGLEIRGVFLRPRALPDGAPQRRSGHQLPGRCTKPYIDGDLMLARLFVRATHNIAFELLFNTIVRVIAEHAALEAAFLVNPSQVLAFYETAIDLVEARDARHARRLVRRLLGRVDRTTIERVSSLARRGARRGKGV